MTTKLLFNTGIFIVLLFVSACQTETKDDLKISEPASDRAAEAQVALLGVFHFGGSSGDLAAMHMADPFGERRQNDILELVNQLAEYKPTKILVEYPRTRQSVLDERYNNYLLGKDTLRVNETQQVGFRLAEKLGHSKLYAIDYNLDLPADGLVEYCQRHDKMSEFEDFVRDVKAYVEKDNRALDTMRLSSYLATTNTDSIDRLTNDLYIGHALSWGDSINEAGADFAATWWKRNLVILKNIAETVESKEDRILVIIGSGHRAVLKNLVIDRSDMEYVEAGTYLQ